MIERKKLELGINLRQIKGQEVMKKIITSGLFSFLGAALAVYCSSYFEQENWNARFTLEQKKIVMEKRVLLIEKTVKLVNKAPTIIGLRASLEAEKNSAFMHVLCMAKGAPSYSDTCNKYSGNLVRVEEISKEIHDLNAEASATITLSAIYFGPKTNAILRKINKSDPWIMSQQETQDLINAMSSELTWFE